MKSSIILQLAALSTAFVLPDQNVMQEVQVDSRRSKDSIFERLPPKDRFLNRVDRTFDRLSSSAKGNAEKYAGHAHDVAEDALSGASDASDVLSDTFQEAYFDTKNWLEAAHENAVDHLNDLGIHDVSEDHDHPPHHKPGHGHHEPNMTVYQLIQGYKYSQKLAAAINKFPDLVDALNSTKTNFTVFAPTDQAFEKIPEHHEPSEEFLRAILEYHVSPDFYPAGRVLATRTIPTLLTSDALGGKPQRLATQIGLRGLTVNFYSRIIAVNVFGTNGVIHGVDSIILPPPDILKIIDLLPTEFSTLELGLGKTGLLQELNETAHSGGTFFAPSNFAFQKLGTRINAFLFSTYGQKYLKALIKYHVVANQTLYSDAYYKPSEDSDKQDGPPRGFFHVELPTLLEDHSLGIDIARYGRLIEIKINGFSRVSVPDGVAMDGVLHVVSEVLIPPKKLANGKLDMWDGAGELTENDLIERLQGLVEGEYDEGYESMEL